MNTKFNRLASIKSQIAILNGFRRFLRGKSYSKECIVRVREAVNLALAPNTRSASSDKKLVTVAEILIETEEKVFVVKDKHYLTLIQKIFSEEKDALALSSLQKETLALFFATAMQVVSSLHPEPVHLD